MKITIERYGGDVPTDLAGFADHHGMEMVVSERDAGFAEGDGRFYARFRDAEVMDGGCLVGTHGNGATPEIAMREYAQKIAGKRLALSAWTLARREIDVPNELHYGPTTANSGMVLR